MALSREEIVARLIKAGGLEVVGGDRNETESYFNVAELRFHGPDGQEVDYAGLSDYSKPSGQPSTTSPSAEASS